MSTSLFPRLEKLRQTHKQPPPQLLTGKLAHISKKKSVKSGIYYKVTICHNCSDSNESVVLGCFADLESAILANDVYEILSHRKIHVHQLTEDDMKYANELTVSRSWRNQVVEVNLMELMKENVSRSEINPSSQIGEDGGNEHVDNNSKKKSMRKSSSNINSSSRTHTHTSVYRRLMANRFLQLMDSNTNFIQALCCVPQAACDINPVLIALAKLSVELNSERHYPSAATSASSAPVCTASVPTAPTSAPTTATTTPKFYNIKNLEAILTSAIACGLLSTSLIQLLSASCLEEAVGEISDKAGDAAASGGGGLTLFLRNSLGVESIASLSDTALLKTSMIQAIASKKHIVVWGDMMRQLLRTSHTVALKCEMDLHLPVWDAGVSIDTQAQFQSIWETSLLYYNVVQELVSSLHAGAESVASGYSMHTAALFASTVAGVSVPVPSSVTEDTNQINSLLDLARCTVVLTLSSLGTAVLLNNHFGLLPAAHLNSVFEHLVKWESIIRTTNISHETAVVPFALYECIKLEVFSTFINGELKSTHNSVDIRPQLLLAAQMSAITLRMLNKEPTSTKKQSPAKGNNKDGDQKKRPHSSNQYKALNMNNATSKRMFGIKNELALRINISLMCLAVATGDLSCMGTIHVTEAVIIAVHTLLKKLTQWLDITEGGCGVMFSQTHLCLFKCVQMENELVSQLKESGLENWGRFEMVHEISSLAEQVLRSLATRSTLANMLLQQLQASSPQNGHVKEGAYGYLSVAASPLLSATLSQPRAGRKAHQLSFEGDGEECRDDITEIISMYSQSCRSISSYTLTKQKTSSSRRPTSPRRRKNTPSSSSGARKTSPGTGPSTVESTATTHAPPPGAGAVLAPSASATTLAPADATTTATATTTAMTTAIITATTSDMTISEPPVASGATAAAAAENLQEHHSDSSSAPHRVDRKRPRYTEEGVEEEEEDRR